MTQHRPSVGENEVVRIASTAPRRPLEHVRRRESRPRNSQTASHEPRSLHPHAHGTVRTRRAFSMTA